MESSAVAITGENQHAQYSTSLHDESYASRKSKGVWKTRKKNKHRRKGAFGGGTKRLIGPVFRYLRTRGTEDGQPTKAGEDVTILRHATASKDRNSEAIRRLAHNAWDPGDRKHLKITSSRVHVREN